MTVISVIVGSTREGRFSEKPAKWILHHLKKRDGVDARYSICCDFPMPFFDQPVTPATPGRLAFEDTRSFRDGPPRIAQSDGFVFVIPLNTTTDPAAAAQRTHRLGLSGGGIVKAAARELWRLLQGRTQRPVTPPKRWIELHARPDSLNRSHYPVAHPLMAHTGGGDVDAGLAELEAPSGKAMIDDLLWWTTALNDGARQRVLTAAARQH